MTLAEINQERILQIKNILEHYLGLYLIDDNEPKFISVKDKKLIKQLFQQLNEIE